MKYVLDLNIDLCVACGACAIACMDQNDIDTEHGEAPFRVVYDLESGSGKLTYVSVSCMHCQDAPCVQACPVGCLRKEEDTGFIIAESTNCIGCHSCSLACPFGAPSFAADGKMHKCDGCFTRVKCGLDPACVRHCPTGALQLRTEEELRQDRGTRSLKRLTEERLG